MVRKHNFLKTLLLCIFMSYKNFLCYLKAVKINCFRAYELIKKIIEFQEY